MATMILSGVGSAIGGAVAGPFGALIGQAIGALGGAVIDNAVFGESREVERGRIGDVHLQTSSQGQSIPRVYGRARVSGEVIWATRFEEVVSREKHGGGKGGGGSSTTVTTHSYFANFAIGLCEGPIADVRRIWVDGKLLDRQSVNMRIYKGTSDQLPDPLVEAKQGTAPAYRGLAYVVFERLPLEAYGNRLPQISFEVIRAVEPLEPMVRGITLIPGADEFIYATTEVLSETGPGATRTLNRHCKSAGSDLAASLDELQALCPNLETVALVVSWFGNDLRCGECQLEPKVTYKNRNTWPQDWQVAGYTRATAPVVSDVEGRPAYGGTPSDASVREAIAELKRRGLKVMLYPFILMDIPEGNGLPDPYGGSEQAAHPWRGRLTTSLAADMAGTPQGSEAARTEVDRFVGTVDEAGYRRFIHHHADLAVSAGGVDAFLIGTELKNLTRIYSSSGVFPFVEALMALAGEVRAKLGDDTTLSYAADWSEYGSFVPRNGELRFPLDPLWAHAEIDVVGIDWYVPLTDQRGSESAEARYNPALLREGLSSGEYHDWYYESAADRVARQRTTITDGAYGKPWVYRSKDLKSWWSEAHVERANGVELSAPTPWVPQSKPIWLTELGFPAVDLSANQPNVFYDEKSSESALPHFSSGARDDLVQRRALEAVLSTFSAGHPDLEMGENPTSAVYGGPMVDPDGIFLWTWDARPFPAFPKYTGEWSDGINWYRGHWLNGRLGGVSAKGLLRQLVKDFGIPEDAVRLEEAAATLDGLVVPGITSVRSVLEPLMSVLGLVMADEGVQLALRSKWSGSGPGTGTGTGTGADTETLGLGDLVVTREGEAPLTLQRSNSADLPAELRLSGYDPYQDYARVSVATRYGEASGARVLTQSLQISAGAETLQMLCEKQMQSLWQEKETARFILSPRHAHVTPGDVVRLGADLVDGAHDQVRYRVERLTWGDALEVDARQVSQEPKATSNGVPGLEKRTAFNGARVGPPTVVIADLPRFRDGADDGHPVIAVHGDPWPGPAQVYRSSSGASYDFITEVATPATMGRLSAPLPAGPVWRWDTQSRLIVTELTGALQSADPMDVLSGANLCAVEVQHGEWELLQFQEAELIAVNTYQLTGLLRGQQGTEHLAQLGAPEGSGFLLLNEAVERLPFSEEALQRAFYYRILPAGEAFNSALKVDKSYEGTGIALRPLSPVHLKAQQSGLGDIEVSWVRRTRLNGDNWALAQVPVGEVQEAYRVRVETQSGDLRREVEVTAPRWTYTTAMQADDSIAAGEWLVITVAQLSNTVGSGKATSKAVEIMP
ncbi:glycoside hydrolase TIM-barrel-like domain-containing protein [Pseudovibrio exalbescens]|uniref:baseplate multidomain protein megatron n=1 Tax=Pseudovibrio exalbescens TaxID=197461 RepID=UPI002365F3EE|nr:glycoside hydrolase TIM-barrel-like domain-containing protein [Pseudovibrio exalbescens]MDD7909135.1 glycoside hydrolase TIM-barrel-like domain-containing protein [Pseudovibrio exalbescens]